MKTRITCLTFGLISIVAVCFVGCERPDETPPPADTPPIDQPNTPPPVQ